MSVSGSGWSTSLEIPASSPTSRRILVTGADAEKRGVLGQMLALAGCGIAECEVGEEAVARATDWMSFPNAADREARPISFAFDAIVVDGRIGGRRALETLGRIRQVDPSTPVLFIATKGDSVVQREAKRLGAAAVIAPPFSAVTLQIALLSSAARLRRAS